MNATIDVTKFVKETSSGLKYQVSGHHIDIFNAMGTRIAALNMDMVDSEGIYNDIWYEYVTPEEFREIFGGAYLEFFEQSNVSKKLCNTDELKGGIDDATNEWFNSYLMPKLMAAGLKYNAIVLPKEVFANISMNEFKLESGFITKMFNSKEEAISWLKSV